MPTICLLVSRRGSPDVLRFETEALSVSEASVAARNAGLTVHGPASPSDTHPFYRANPTTAAAARPAAPSRRESHALRGLTNAALRIATSPMIAIAALLLLPIVDANFKHLYFVFTDKPKPDNLILATSTQYLCWFIFWATVAILLSLERLRAALLPR